MKYPAYFSLFFVACLMQPHSADARIGESRDGFERRLFTSGGIVLRDEDERTSRRQGGPYTSYMKYLGGSAEARVYFKSDDGRKPNQSEVAEKALGSGWEVHVLYVNGKSVLELYKRVGTSASEYETNALLGILGGGGFWKEPEKPAADEEEEDAPLTAFGFDYMRSDGEVRAKTSGGGLMVFQKQLDEFLAKKHESTLLEKAPLSVQGF
jgi:hypothetical protein